ncbi:hypothetical protein A2U01_0098608, partial [Trifolium medium]|nr:hypothetical protein [Trifolium medium]
FLSGRINVQSGGNAYINQIGDRGTNEFNVSGGGRTSGAGRANSGSASGGSASGRRTSGRRTSGERTRIGRGGNA